jgi:hypothetical protein
MESKLQKLEQKMVVVNKIDEMETKLMILSEKVTENPQAKELEKLMAEVQLQLQVQLDEGSAKQRELVQDVQHALNFIRDDIVTDRRSTGAALKTLQAELDAVKWTVAHHAHAQPVAARAPVASSSSCSTAPMAPVQPAQAPAPAPIRAELRLKRQFQQQGQCHSYHSVVDPHSNNPRPGRR